MKPLLRYLLGTTSAVTLLILKEAPRSLSTFRLNKRLSYNFLRLTDSLAYSGSSGTLIPEQRE